jgi:hypothetical protein
MCWATFWAIFSNTHLVTLFVKSTLYVDYDDADRRTVDLLLQK